MLAQVLTDGKHAIPKALEKPMVTSGIRVESAAGASRGFGAADHRGIANSWRVSRCRTKHQIRMSAIDERRT
ncbi:hypothetical protein [Azospirillum sp. TSH64]|uniref:hypothetical protein n=1 Tax=Azospirillum sp. TSH64 TaxID=652740 RepID=UPI000D60C8AB|nr:hypothetical protein [Azospirillum sp. TSH64]PWC78849.1 hypothetical protein TSH64_32785 [Azospirillum sp. TSH64]